MSFRGMSASHKGEYFMKVLTICLLVLASLSPALSRARDVEFGEREVVEALVQGPVSGRFFDPDGLVVDSNRIFKMSRFYFQPNLSDVTNSLNGPVMEFIFDRHYTDDESDIEFTVEILDRIGGTTERNKGYWVSPQAKGQLRHYVIRKNIEDSIEMYRLYLNERK